MQQLCVLGMTFLRITIGIIFMIHGFPKLSGGAAKWLWYGQQMELLGITLYPVFWGLCAAIAEFLGGLLITLGLTTRISACLLAFVMIVALLYHINKGDGFMMYSHALSMLCVFIALAISGSGPYSLDAYFNLFW